MNSPEDNTAVLRMHRDFEDFISRSNQGQQSASSKSSAQRTFGGSFLSNPNLSAVPVKKTSVSMKQIIEKEKEDKFKQVELLRARTQITQLEKTLSTVETSRKRSRIEHERDMENVRTDYKHEHEKIDGLRQQLHLLVTKEEEAREQLKATQRLMEGMKSSLEQKLLTVQRDKHRAESDYQEKEQTLRAQLMELKKENMRKQTELEICQSQSAETTHLLDLANRRLSDANQQIAELEESRITAQRSEEKVRELELKLAHIDSDATIARTMKAQLDRLNDTERENKHLHEENSYHRDTQENVLLLREETEGLRCKLERAEQRCVNFDKLQLEYKDLKERVHKWETVECATGVKMSRSPSQLKQQLAELQDSNVVLLERQGRMQSSAHAYSEQAKSAEQKLQVVQEQLAREQHRAQQPAEFIRRLQRKLLLVTKERDGYKEIMDSYESELTVNVASTTNQRAKQLEEAVQGYRNHVNILEEELERCTEQLAQARTCVHLLESQVNTDRRRSQPSLPVFNDWDQKLLVELRATIAEREKQIERLMEEKGILEERMERKHMQGDYDPTKTKVMHLSLNPVAVAQRARQQEVGRLREEKQQLKQRLAVLEEAGGQVDDLTVQVQARMNQPSSSKQVDEVKKQLSMAELKNKRLMEAFKKTSHEFREVCYQLLGFRIDISRTNQYKLMSMYADSGDDCLIFQQGETGEMQILETIYSATLSDKIDTYLRTMDSIPGFLSSITMDLLSKQTMMQQT